MMFSSLQSISTLINITRWARVSIMFYYDFRCNILFHASLNFIENCLILMFDDGILVVRWCLCVYWIAFRNCFTYKKIDTEFSKFNKQQNKTIGFVIYTENDGHDVPHAHIKLRIEFNDNGTTFYQNRDQIKMFRICLFYDGQFK